MSSARAPRQFYGAAAAARARGPHRGKTGLSSMKVISSMPGEDAQLKPASAVKTNGAGLPSPVGRPDFKSGERRQTSQVSSTPTLFRHFSLLFMGRTISFSNKSIRKPIRGDRRHSSPPCALINDERRKHFVAITRFCFGSPLGLRRKPEALARNR